MLLLLAATALADPGFRYVKIVDRGGYTDSQSSPGADIDAIELVREGVVVATATAVLEASIGQGDHGNAVADPSAALGPPDHRPRTLDGFVALGGPGHHLVLELGAPARIGDLLRVWEAGSGGRPEHTEVCVAAAATGPWRSLGSGFDRFEVVVAEAPDRDPESACRALANS